MFLPPLTLYRPRNLTTLFTHPKNPKRAGKKKKRKEKRFAPLGGWCVSNLPFKIHNSQQSKNRNVQLHCKL